MFCYHIGIGSIFILFVLNFYIFTQISRERTSFSSSTLSTKKNKVKIVQSSNVDYFNRMKQHVRSIQRYARVRNYSFYFEKQEEFTKISKPLFLKKQLELDEDEDWLVWLDTDMQVMDFSITIESLIPNECDLIVQNDEKTINSGFMILKRKSPHVREIVDNWLYFFSTNPLTLFDQNPLQEAILHYALEDRTSNHLCPNSVTAERFCYNQTLARHGYDFKHRQRIKRVCSLDLALNMKESRGYCDGDFLRHEASTTNFLFIQVNNLVKKLRWIC